MRPGHHRLRERLVALEPRDKGILVYTLRMADEVVPPKDAFADIPATRPDRMFSDAPPSFAEVTTSLT